jgi:hypothetical protein
VPRRGLPTHQRRLRLFDLHGSLVELCGFLKVPLLIAGGARERREERIMDRREREKVTGFIKRYGDENKTSPSAYSTVYVY